MSSLNVPRRGWSRGIVVDPALSLYVGAITYMYIRGDGIMRTHGTTDNRYPSTVDTL